MKEQISLNKARIKKAGKTFEIVIDPKAAYEFKEGKILDVKEVLKDVHIYSDVNKGLKCGAEELKRAFSTDDPLEIAKEILVKGETQMTAEQRSAKREQKRKEVIQLIKKYGVDPRTKAPHPETRIEAAIEEAKIKIDENRSADEQVTEIIKQLLPLLPIKFETKTIEMHIPAEFAQKSYATVKKFGVLKKDQWLNDGSWSAQVEIPGGLETDFYDQMNKVTHGNIHVKVIN